MGLRLAFRSQGTEPTSTTLHLSKVNAGSREGCLWRPSPSGLSRPAPRPPHQDGAQRHLEIGHLVSPTGVTSPRGVFQGLEAPEVHAPVHGRHAGLEGHGAGQRRSVRLAEGGGPSAGEASRAAFPRWSQRVAPAAPQEAGGGHRSPRDGCVRIYKEPRGAGAASTSCPQQPGWGLLLQRSRGGAGWDWQEGASISPPRPPPDALPLALPVPGLQAPSPASQPASVSARLGDGASTSPRSHSTHQSSRALARRRSGGHTESQGPLRYS